MTGPRRMLQGLLARGQKTHLAPEGVRRRLCHDQMRDMYGVERAAEQRPRPAATRQAAQGVEGVDGVALESAGAGQVRSSPDALG